MKTMKTTTSVISLAVLSVSARFVATPDTAWYLDDVVDSVQVIVLCAIIARLSVKHIATWCLVVAYGTCETVEAVSNIAWYAFDLYNPWVDVIRVVIAVIALGYYRLRRYDVTSATLHSSHMYLTYRKPRTRQDRMLALFGVPLGGVGVYCRGSWYHYKRGVFVISECKPNTNHVIIQAKAYKKSVINQLEDMAGTRWGILHNCMTEILPIVRLGRRLPFLPTPR
ncbi:TMhelix containing protein [Vibrio phage 1.250.O._10N.261.55.E11]|nr:TMhelix containing protein [Vibrio phage 1.250.O._10N.261.55.E11]